MKNRELIEILSTLDPEHETVLCNSSFESIKSVLTGCVGGVDGHFSFDTVDVIVLGEVHPDHYSPHFLSGWNLTVVNKQG